MARDQAEERASSGPLNETAANTLVLLSIAIAMAIVVLVPVVLNPDLIRINPVEVYYPTKFKVLAWLSVALLATVLGSVALRRKPLAVPMLIPVLAFLGIAALSTVFSDAPMHSLFGDRKEGLISLSGEILLFYAMARGLNSLVRVRVFLIAMVTAGTLVSIYGISQNYGFDPVSGWLISWYSEIGRPFATIGNPITLASYLTLMAGAAMALYFTASSPSRQVPWLIALALIGACWIYTDTRGAMLSVVAALPVILWISHRKMGTVQPLQVPFATLILAVITALMASAAFGNLSLPSYVTTPLIAYLILLGAILWLSDLRPAVMGPLLTVLLALTVVAGVVGVAVVASNMGILNLTTVGREGGLSAQVRLLIWRDTIPTILERPLLGHGPDNFTAPFQAHMGEALKSAITTGTGEVSIVDRAHNDFLQVAATTGLLGLAAYVWVLVSYFRNSYKGGGWPLLALSGGVLAYILQIQTSFSTAATSVAFWGILGTSAAIIRIQGAEEDDQASESRSSAATVSTREAPRARLYEILTFVVVVAVIASIAFPTFMDQREQAAKVARTDLKLYVRQTVKLYDQTNEARGTYPRSGVYTSEDKIRGPLGMRLRPPDNIKITTRTPGQGFRVLGKSTTLSGTFKYSYSSATNKYAFRP
ncbi:MAG: O-antigen ligase family protein [Rubrobacter sp.]|nr:O-antigen ligase family protein [Rubrobacter sp.]